MDNIKTETDIVRWARTIVDAKGEKYTPLSKNDLYTIALYVIERSNIEMGEKPENDSVKQEEENKPVSKDPQEQPIEPTQPRTDALRTTRSYALHCAGLSAQQAYDKFLEWCKEHPKDGMVMDFATGTRSANAAFAYWLTETITADIARV